MTRTRGLAGLVLIGPAILALLAGPVAADQGVAVDVGRIDLEVPVVRGESYTLPSIGVRNPGTESTRYLLSVSDLETDRSVVPAVWVSFAPEELTLEPGERQRVQPTLHVPLDAEPGSYETLLAASIAGEGAGARVGAAAATRLVFEVSAKGTAAPDDGGPGWWVWAVAVLAAVVAAVLIRFLSRVRIRVERR